MWFSMNQDETADNSIGNVTGTTAVNVFLGIGIAWQVVFVFVCCKNAKSDFIFNRMPKILQCFV